MEILMNIEEQYLNLLRKILNEGELKHNRTGVDTLAIAGAMLEHDFSEGFPLLTTRKLPFKSTKVELEFFIKGLTDKQWLINRGCHYWDFWANPQKVPYGNDDETKKKMAAETDLGLVYGYQWRNFCDPRYDEMRCDASLGGIDQLANIVETLKKNPDDRRMICTAWNPLALKYMALVPCHYSFQVIVINGKLNLLWNQRSCDFLCGIPQNICSYALLLHLLAKESGLQEGKLIGFLGDVHVYVTHIENAKIQLSRTPKRLPRIETPRFTSIFDWEFGDTTLHGYESYDKLKFEVAV